jgi:GT2 family glycosyltransferase
VHTQQQLEMIKMSTSWRATTALRYIGARLPTPLRRQLRRVLKAAWWTVTPWKMPARIRFLRHRKAVTALPVRNGPVIASVPSNDALADVAPNHFALTSDARHYTYIPPAPPENLREQLTAMSTRPWFSIVVPVYNTPPNLLNKLVASVLAQWYPYWELILVNDNSPQEQVRVDLNALMDPRIVIIHLCENKGISGATNEGMSRAIGDYIVFADHDDELTANCLYELACCIQRESPDYIYSDENKIAENGQFVQPHFKPDWSPDTMMSSMFTCHVSCVRRELIAAVGGLRSEYDGSQDWDFILRITEKTSRIVHIPKILYHWRIIPASVASDLMAKPYASDAGKRAREDALARRGLDGWMEPVENLPGYFHTVYRLHGEPKISIVIPSKNNYKILKQCLDSIQSKTVYQNFQVIVIDNGSTDADTLRYLGSLRHTDERITVLPHDKPFNFSELCNLGAAQSDGELLLFLNDDTEVLTPDWLERLGGYAQLPHVGAVGAKLLYPDREHVQHVGVVNLLNGPDHAFLGADANDPGYFARAALEYDWLAVTGACLMVDRAKFEQAGGFDEGLPIAYNDVDLCFRLVEHGFYNMVSPAVKLVHHESYSRGQDHQDPIKLARLRRDRETLYFKHPRFYAHDPFHNPNLAPNSPRFHELS